MHSIKRPAAALGAAAVLALSLTACGGGASGAPEDASEKEFCDAYMAVGKEGAKIEGDKPTEDEFDAVVEKVEALGDVGTPESVSEDERKGFEVYIDEITDLSYDDVKDSDEDDDLFNVSDDEDKNAEKFISYATETCAEAATE